MSNINNNNPFNRPSGPFHSDPGPRTNEGKGKGKERAATPESRTPSPAPSAELDMEAVASARSAADEARPATYNYYNPLHQAGSSGAQMGVATRGAQAAAAQPSEGAPSSASRASAFSERARKASALTVKERVDQIEERMHSEKKGVVKQVMQQIKAMKERVPKKLSARVPSLPSHEKTEKPFDKFEGYALNSKHTDGGPKSHVFAKAGFKLINEWVKGVPESWQAPMRADPEF